MSSIAPYPDLTSPFLESRRVQLQGLLRDNFSLEEIKTLAANIGVDFDELKGEGKTPKIRELILYVERRNELDRLIAAAVQERPKAPWPQKQSPSATCPYRGLSPFGEKDAPFFFGRERVVEQLMAAVNQRELIAVVGSSGSGKSSVVFAGLLPQLRRQGEWIIVPSRPGRQPFDELAYALIQPLESQMSETDRLLEAHKLSEALNQKTISLWSVLHRIAQKDTGRTRTLLVVDQFEELYANEIDDQTRQNFLDALLTVVNNARGQAAGQTPIKLLLTLRADFMGRVLNYRPLADALQERDLKLGPMTREEMESTIQLPADKSELRFETGLVKRILDDLLPSGPSQMDTSNLPLLEFALEQLWTLRKTDGLLTHEAYGVIGEVGGAISHFADQLYEGLEAPAQTNMRRVLVQMVHPGGVEDTRRWVTRSDIGDARWPYIEQLAAARLVVTDRDRTGEDIAEVIHEALIQNWGRMQGWMTEERPFRIWQDQMRTFLVQWQKARSDDDLMRGAFLAESLIWLQKRSEDLTPGEIDFIQQSVVIDRSLRHRLTRSQIMAGCVGAAVFAAVATALAGFILWPVRDPSINIPRFPYAFLVGLQGGLLGAFQGGTTILGIIWADRLAKKPSRYTRALGGAALGGITGGVLFLLLYSTQSLPSGVLPGTVYVFGVVMFGLSSGGASLITDSRKTSNTIQQVLMGMLAAGVSCFIAIAGLYIVMDVSAATAFLYTVLGFTALEMGFGGGMNFGLATVSGRLRSSTPAPH